MPHLAAGLGLVVLYGYSILHLTAVLTSGWVGGTRKGIPIPSIALCDTLSEGKSCRIPRDVDFLFYFSVSMPNARVALSRYRRANASGSHANALLTLYSAGK